MPNGHAGELLRILGNVRLHSANDLTGYIGAIVYNAADENVSDNRYLMMLNRDGNTDTYMTLPVVSRYVVPTAGTYREEIMYQRWEEHRVGKEGLDKRRLWGTTDIK